MKIFLIKDLKKVGKKGEIVNVSDGYGANFIIPQGYGKLLTDNVLGEYHAEVKKQKEEDAKRKSEAIEAAKKLDSITVVFSAKVGKSGSMIGSISPKAIVEAYKKQFDINLDKRKIIDHFQVNAFGTTNLRIELYKDVVATLHVKVVPIEENK
ncbi:MAG: 50S ribosomal protein L9 [Firmicutes bacterium]|uniref:Large ribosomal subunit protein bL9 n=1 Tax=Candidatus Scatoplasma merdavium TaxID=2840932 RepID=A0A9D9GS29_9BACL|nr:50S ribosomal protein L9 [Candidatus Scatoplasma merdavium]